jgi:alpha-beta hydrolase superfamily lysophospholipase
MLQHKPFWVIADYLTRRGIAVLRVDDRGVGKSTGDSTLATLDDMVGDVLAGVEFLKGRKQIDAQHIGVIGHCEGGIVGPAAAVRSTLPSL